MDLLSTIDSLVKTYSFTKEVILVIFGAVFGAICTNIVNNGAMRKQCQFDMQYKILQDESDNVESLYKKVEALEIFLSFNDGNTEKYLQEIDEIQKLLLRLNDRLRIKRKFVRKYVTATILEKTAKYVTDYMKIMYVPSGNGYLDFQIISKADNHVIGNLRCFVINIQKLSNDMSEATEHLISPGLISKIKRFLRKPLMVIEECIAIAKVHRQK